MEPRNQNTVKPENPPEPTVVIDGKQSELSSPPLPTTTPIKVRFFDEPLIIMSIITFGAVALTAWLFYDGAKKGDDGEGWLALTAALVCVPLVFGTIIIYIINFVKLLKRKLYKSPST